MMVSQRRRTDTEAKAVKRMLTEMGAFLKYRSTMPAQYITAFLLVAEEEGLGVADYAKRAGVSVSVMSRHLLDIGPRNRNMKEGYEWVEYRSNPMELRKHEYTLTDRGRAILHHLVRAGS
jgi:DNA-binding MarR family transcriptional regulator